MSLQCPRCKVAVRPQQTFCSKCGLFFTHNMKRELTRQVVSGDYQPRSLEIGDYSLSTDFSVCKAVAEIPVLSPVVETLISIWDKPMERAKLLGDGIRLGTTQFPAIHKIAEISANTLQIPVPEIFIKYDPKYGAYTLGTNEDHMVVLHSSLVEDFTPEELAFILGHEFGHIKSKHVTYHTAGYLMAKGMSGLSQLLIAPLQTALDAWSRESEFTADRAGLLVSQNPESALKALLLLTVGSRKLLQEINLPSFLRQEADLQNFHGKLNLWLGGYSHPYLVTRVRRLMEFLFSDTYKALSRNLSRNKDEFTSMYNNQLFSGNSKQSAPRLLKEPKKSSTRFCKQCGFEILDADVKECEICGARI